MLNCKFCDRECKNNNSLVQHQIRCNKNDNKIEVKSNFIEYNKKIKNNEITKEYTNQFIKFIELPIDNINLEECEDVATAYIDTLEADHLFALKAEIISSNKIPKNDDIALLKMGRLYFKRNLHSEEKHMIRDKLKQKLS